MKHGDIVKGWLKENPGTFWGVVCFSAAIGALIFGILAQIA